MSDFKLPKMPKVSFDIPAMSFDMSPPKEPVKKADEPSRNELSVSLEEMKAKLKRIDSGEPLPASYVQARRIARRRKINGQREQTLFDLIPELPPPDEDMWVLARGLGSKDAKGRDTGQLDFGAFVPYFVKMLSDSGGVELYITTWRINMRGVQGLIDLMADGLVSKMVVCTDAYFGNVDPVVAHALLDGLEQHGGQFVAFKNHAKIICARNAAGRCAVVTGSANFSSQPRLEQFNLTTAPEVFDFFKTSVFDWAMKLSKGKEDG